MSFIESPRFPEEVSAWAEGGPEFHTDVQISVSGDEKRNIVWQYPLGKWNVGAGLRKLSNAQATIAFFRAAFGRAVGFRMQDPMDYTCDVASGVVTGLTTTTFQLYKKYTAGSTTALRKIIKPVATGFVLYYNGVALTLTTDYTIDTTTGIVTTTTTRTAANITWSGTFDVPVRFDSDLLNLRFDEGGLLQFNNVMLQELRSP